MRNVVLTCALFMAPTVLFAQIDGRVVAKGTNAPIMGASVSVTGKKKAGTVTDKTGRFSLSVPPGTTIKISHISYRAIKARARASGTYYLAPKVNTLNDVVVTAQEDHGLSSASTIRRHAMDHLQPSSFGDLLELLPGGRAKDPRLNVPNIIKLREVPVRDKRYNTTSQGVRFIIDGAPISTNGNMQYLDGADDRTSTKRNFANAGVDMRTLGTDDIQEVTIVRGIPSVKYGDLTSGLVKVKRRKGGNDISARFKADMNSKLFYIAKGLEWKPAKFSINFSADYLNNKFEPRNPLENYQRLTFSVRFNKAWSTNSHDISSALNLDYGGSFDNEKVDPEFNHGGEDKYVSEYNRYAASWTFNLNSKKERSYFRDLELTASYSYQKDWLARTRRVNVTSGTPSAMTMTEGESDAVFITPYRYTATHTVDGRPTNLFLKANATFAVPKTKHPNSLIVGVDYDMDRNLGAGQVYDRLHPVYTGASFRPRKYSDIPATQMLSIYAEEQATFAIGGNRLEIEAGVRGETMLGLGKRFDIRNKIYVDPRVNMGWTFPQIDLGQDPLVITLTGGVGRHTMFPTIDQLYPEPVYMDLVEMNYFHTNASYRRMYLMTYVIDPTNNHLAPARNLKWEIRGDMDWGGNRLTLTYFREDMKSGFRFMDVFSPFVYREFDTDVIDHETVKARPDVNNLPYKTVADLRYYSDTSNGSRTFKQGIEYTLSTIRFPIVNTRLTITGAWFRTEYHNSLPIQYKPSLRLNGSALNLVGIYKDDDGYIREMTNTNFTFDTDIPRLKLGFSLSAQCVWVTGEQSMKKENVPLQYMDESGKVRPFVEADKHDEYKQFLVRHQYSMAAFEWQTIPFEMNLNLKATKKLFGNKMRIALFVNKLWDAHPDYVRKGMTLRRYVTPYFGLETNIKL